MASKMFLAVLCLTLWSKERFSVVGDTTFLITTGFMITNQRILSIIPYENDVPTINDDCGGFVTQAPGTIEATFSKRRALDGNPKEEVHCTWILRAPNGQGVYVRDLQIIRVTRGRDGNLGDDFSDGPLVEVYDGDAVRADKRLFRFGNDTLNSSISNKENMTIDLHHSISDKYIEEKILLNYGFAEESFLATARYQRNH